LLAAEISANLLGMKKKYDFFTLLKDPKLREQLTPPQLMQFIEEVKALSRSIADITKVPVSPAAFALRFGYGRWKEAPHLNLLSSLLVELERGQKRRLMVNMPPRHGKSELISYWFPLWCLARNPERRVIIVGYGQEFAETWGRRTRNAILDFGEELGLKLDTTSKSASEWHTREGGGVVAVGAGGALTGRGADVLILDDTIKDREEADSETIREKLWDWWMSTAFTRLEPGGFCIAIGTRWHEDDILGRLERASELAKRELAENKEPSGLIWEILKLPAIAEEMDPLGRAIGEPLWPERYDSEALKEIRTALDPYQWSALYQQRPSPEEGGGVKKKWWKYYHPEDLPKDFDQMVQSWDLAFKDLTKSDYTVGQVWGRKGAQFFLLAQLRQRMGAPATLRAIQDFWAKYPKAIAKLVEDKANGPAVIAMLANDVPGIIPVKVRSSKDARLSAITPLIQAGNVFLPHPEESPWTLEFVEECAAFPNGINDDQVDAMTQALNFLQPHGWQEATRAWREGREGPPPKDFKEAADKELHKVLKEKMKKQLKEMHRAAQRGMIRPW
jgi:predicted phage terminase large subunit-like protein